MLSQKVIHLPEEQKDILVKQFIEEVGCNQEDAIHYLYFANFDFELSVALYLLMKLKETNQSPRKRTFNMSSDGEREVPLHEQDQLPLNEQEQGQEQEQEQYQEQEQEQYQKPEQCQEPEQLQGNEKEIVLEKETIIQKETAKIIPKTKKAKICVRRKNRKPFRIIKRHKSRVKTTKKLSVEELKFFINQKPCPSWEARLTAFHCYDPTLIKGFKDGIPSQENIEIEKRLFVLYTKLNNGKITSKNLQRGVIAFLERNSYEKVDDRSRKTMLFLKINPKQNIKN
ncbi:ubx domain-containing protein [Anaeramoeba flamelloides]|uniref:Ubx domain-containing protein n=1 Tax=Anaeramoeba flamelloides TaxID=1746091 RepID=A0AAV7YQG4_9EUKA|nr:ubx domain-containing protein [Anaeramoeba flamelloides]